jgi:hypothetical protein
VAVSVSDLTLTANGAVKDVVCSDKKVYSLIVTIEIEWNNLFDLTARL